MGSEWFPSKGHLLGGLPCSAQTFGAYLPSVPQAPPLSFPPALTSTGQSNAAANHGVKLFPSLGADAQEGAFHVLTRCCSTDPLQCLTLIHICEEGMEKRCHWDPGLPLPPVCPRVSIPCPLPATYLSNAAHPWHFHSPGHRYIGRSLASYGRWHGHHRWNCSGTRPHLQRSRMPTQKSCDPLVAH